MWTRFARSRSHCLLALAGAALSLGFADLTHAQYTVGNPRPLDRNPTVGLNGHNPTTATDIGALTRYNNAVVTGNAGYGRSFQGYVGYLAPDDFRASLGTNALFNFRRDSASGAQTTQGIRGTDSLRYQFMLSTGQTPPSLLRGATASGAVPLFSRDSNAVTSNTGAALRSTSDYLGTRALQPSVVGYRTDDQGQSFALTASPLLGVTMVPIDLPGAPRKTSDDSVVPTGQLPTSGIPTPSDGKTSPTGTSPDSGFPAKKKDTRTLSGLEATRPGLMSPLAAQQIVDTTNAAARVDTRATVPTAIMDPFKRNLPADKMAATKPDPNAPPDTTKPSKSVWEKELDQLSERLKKDELEKKKKTEQGTPRTDDKSTNEPAPANPNPLSPGIPSSKDPHKTSTSKTKTTTKAPPAQLTLDDIRALTRPDLEQLDRDVLHALASTRPVLDHLVPAKPTDNIAYDYHMLAGETFLSDGQFFDAEDRFLRALAASPMDPLASVGRAHAQLGAGLYLSAASNLHSLFAEHPEMIGARYQRALLFSDARSDAITKQMRADIASPDTLLGRDAALLLAYVGYQRGDRAALEEGVKAFASSLQSDNDDDRADLTLLLLMQRVWVDGDKEPASPQPPPTPPPPPPTTGDK